jgi:hypothetical protein
MFLVNIPRMEFAAVVPKGEYVSFCLLGRDIDQELLESFLTSPSMKTVMPTPWDSSGCDCRCMPKMAIRAASRSSADRVVLIGDAGTTRLYKDGIGAAYKTAKAAATTAVLHDVSATAFQRHYEPVCRTLEVDNRFGRMVFFVASWIRRLKFAQRAVVLLVHREQSREGNRRYLSTVLWDMFTGSAPYKQIFLRTLRPVFIGNMVWALVRALFRRPAADSLPAADFCTGDDSG